MKDYVMIDRFVGLCAQCGIPSEPTFCSPSCTAQWLHDYKTRPAPIPEPDIVIDLTPTWWQRNRFIQRVRHFFGKCEGTGMVMGRECPWCYQEVAAYFKAKDAQKYPRSANGYGDHTLPK